MPTGERPIFFSIKSAQNRRLNMIADVKTNRMLPWSGVRILPVMLWIQPSVPNSTAPTNTCVINNTNSSHAPMAQ